MIIEYLRELENLNSQNLQDIFPNKPLPVTDIFQLEQLYNNGKPFPKVLRELLHIAGNKCSVISLSRKGPFLYQLAIREAISNSDHTISRPFFAFDQFDIDLFSLVFLDEETEDPEIVHFNLNEEESSYEYMMRSGVTLSNLIKGRIVDVKKGYNYY
ncbi:hypothetical protein ACX0HA_01640 [Flavobacterium hauense]